MPSLMTAHERKLGFFETPPHYVTALLDRVPELTESRTVIIEPCVGEGAIARYFPGRCLTNDLDPERDAQHHDDASTADMGGWPVADWIVTNPPFEQAAAILKNALKTDLQLAFCLRLSFLEPVKARRTLPPPDSLIVLPRYSFRLNDQSKRQTDSVTCAWMIWNYCLEPPIQMCW